MGLFTAYVDQMPSQVAVLGGTIRVPMTRDFPREGFAIRVEGTHSGPGNEFTAGKLLNIVKRVRLVVNDGSTTRSIVDADGYSILQRHVHYNQALDLGTLREMTRVTGSGNNGSAVRVTYPHFFAPGVLNSPTRDLFLQNFPRFNTDPYLEIQLASSAELDLQSSAAFSSLTVTILDFKRVVNIPNWNFLNVAFETFQRDYPTDAPNQRYPIPIPGYHFAIGIRPYTYTGRTFGDVSRAEGLLKIQALNQVERSLSYSSLQIINNWSDAPLYTGIAALPGPITEDFSENVTNSQAIVQSSAWLDYLTDQTGSDVVNLDTLFNTNAFVNIGATPEIVWDVAGGANKSVIYMHDRCFGDITGALALLQNSRKR